MSIAQTISHDCFRCRGETDGGILDAIARIGSADDRRTLTPHPERMEPTAPKDHCGISAEQIPERTKSLGESQENVLRALRPLVDCAYNGLNFLQEFICHQRRSNRLADNRTMPCTTHLPVDQIDGLFIV